MRRLGGSSIGLKRTAFQDLKRLTLLLAYGIEDSPWRARTGFIPPVPDPPNPSRITVRTPRAGETLDADVVVIGSGPGGGVTAAMLAEAGKRVLVLERAAMVGEDRFGGPELDGLGALFLDRGLAATSDRWISIRAGSAVGGGSVVNWASSLRAPAEVRDEWRTAGVGDDLDEHYSAIEADIGVTSDESPPQRPQRPARRRPRRHGPAVAGHPPQRPRLRRLRAMRRRLPERSEAVRAPALARIGVRARGPDPGPYGGPARHRGGRAGHRRRRAGSRWRDHGARADGGARRGIDPLPRGPPAVRDRPWSRGPDPPHPPRGRRLGHLRRADGALVRRPPERHVGRLRGRRRRVGVQG